MKLSVVICTHNPRDDYLGRTLDALRQQRLPKSEWELVVIDNASNPPLAGRLDLSWHPDFRLILEPEPGVIMARICGIREARHKVIVFVDDDNALAPDYLENSLSIAHNFPMIGAWGGQQIPEFEAEPSPALADFLPFLALRQFSKAQWSNYDTSMEACPFGAGMGVRAEVARLFCEKADSRPIFLRLGRRQKSLMGGEDVDMALTSFRLGLGTGVFPELKLIHLISAWRVEPAYLFRLVAAGVYAGRLLALLNNGKALENRQGRLRKWVKTSLPLLNLLHRLGRLPKSPAYYKAATQGLCQAEDDYLRHQSGKALIGVDHLYTK
jgi:glycosyltransferase involved in cell wall biosynthesis